MRLVLDEPQPIESLRKVYNDRVTFVTTTNSWPLVSEIQFKGDYYGTLRKRQVPAKVGKRVDREIEKYKKKLTEVWDYYQARINRIIRFEDTALIREVLRTKKGSIEKQDITLARVLRERNPRRQFILRQKFLQQNKDKLIQSQLVEMEKELRRVSRPSFRSVYKLGKLRGQLQSDQELDDRLTAIDRRILKEKDVWNSQFLRTLTSDSESHYETILGQQFDDSEELVQALEEAKKKERYRLALFAAAVGSVLLAAGTARAARDVTTDPKTGEEKEEAVLDEETGIPIGIAYKGGNWNTKHDDRVCPGCEGNDGKWMTNDEFQAEAGTNECLTRCRCIELFELSEKPVNKNKVWRGKPGASIKDWPRFKKSDGLQKALVALQDILHKHLQGQHDQQTHAPSASSSLTREELEKWPTNELDRKAFGFSENDIKFLKPSQLNIKYQDDLEGAVYSKEKSGLSDKEWAKSINLAQPIEVDFEKQKFTIQDGHHRFLAAKILNKPIRVNLTIKDNPINSILERSKKLDKHTPGGQSHNQQDHDPTRGKGKKPSQAEIKEIKAQLRPGFRVGEKIYAGYRGQIHADILNERPEIMDQKEKPVSGFVDHNGKFMTRDEALNTIGIGSTEELEDNEKVVKHTPGGKQHDQSTHGRRTGVDPRRPRTGFSNTVASEVAARYVTRAGLAPIKSHTTVKVDKERGGRIAAAYEGMKNDPKNPKVKAAYKAMADEVKAQYKMLPVKIEYTKDDPYPNSESMMRDVLDNKKLRIFTGGEKHSLLGADGADGVTLNDNFRAVHDYFGHVMRGYQFGPSGEENAWMEHSKMFTPLAQRAMTTETRGQNSWFNFSRANEGKAPKDRAFAEQKVGILPDEFLPERARTK